MAMSTAKQRERDRNLSDLPVKMTKKQIDNAVQASYSKHFDRVQINVMDISKIYRVGRDAIAAGENLDEAMAAAVPKFRQN